jgi:hypothetical protein
MKTVVAALNNSLADAPVLAAAQALASLLDARVEALHVRTNGDHTARNAADAAGTPLRTVSGRSSSGSSWRARRRTWSRSRSAHARHPVARARSAVPRPQSQQRCSSQ